MSYHITTDATCDFLTDFNAKAHTVIPMVYLIDGVEYGIDKNLTSKEFYELVVNGAMPTTSLITTYFAKSVLEPILKDGNDVLHICFSSGLSGSYSNLVAAVDELRTEFPDRKIYLIDSLCACGGEALLNDVAIYNRDVKNMTIEDNYASILEYRQHIQHYFTVDDLHHLLRGGRVSKMQAIFGTMLDIKPVLYCNALGKLVPIAKVRSRKKALLALVDKFIERYNKDEGQFTVYINHSDCQEDAEYVKSKIIEKTGFDNIKVGFIGPVIGSHTGKGCVALFFVGDDRYESADETINQ